MMQCSGHCCLCSLYVGVELEQPVGKNDGSVDGTRYFTCKPNHGLFTPSSKVKRLTELFIVDC